MMYRTKEVDSEKVSLTTREMVDFGFVAATINKDKFLELNARFREMLKAYEERGNMIHQLEAQVAQMDKKLGKRIVGESS